MKPQPGDSIEIWCAETCNRIGHGRIIAMVSDNIVKFANEWLDGSVHEGEWDLMPDTLERASNGAGWFACAQ